MEKNSIMKCCVFTKFNIIPSHGSRYFTPPKILSLQMILKVPKYLTFPLLEVSHVSFRKSYFVSNLVTSIKLYHALMILLCLTSSRCLTPQIRGCWFRLFPDIRMARWPGDGSHHQMSPRSPGSHSAAFTAASPWWALGGGGHAKCVETRGGVRGLNIQGQLLYP